MKIELRQTHRLRRRLCGEALEPRYLLSALGFVTREIVEHEIANSVYAADVDGDGDIDVLSAFINKIAWYQNTDGKGTFRPQQVISTEVFDAVSVHASDVDGDGDVDVLSTSIGDGKIAWYENIDGTGSFGPQRIIDDLGARMYAADVDGDGDVDVVGITCCGPLDRIVWYENTDGAGTFGPQQVISTEVNGGRSVHATDVDGDGDVDVLSASSDFLPASNKIAWYENTDGAGSFGKQRVITTGADGANSVYAADVDGDGDVDVLSASASDDKIAWYENTDGKGAFGLQQAITTEALGAESVHTADVDGDGDVDVLSASSTGDKIAWYENTDGKGTFGPQQVITTEADRARSVFAADVDGDGDADVLSASSGQGEIAWYDNTDGQGMFEEKNIINRPSTVRSVYAADVDGDGDMDVLSASWLTFDFGKIIWFENIDGKGTFFRPHVISTGAHWSVFAADVDGDPDLDVLSTSIGGDIHWYENRLAGDATLGPPRVITTEADNPPPLYVADLDGDGDVDVLSSRERGRIAWHENTDGMGTFRQHEVTTLADVASVGSTYAADVDGDGDLDVLSANRNDSRIAWYENINGQGTFGEPQVITTRSNGRSVYAADLDGDEDMDVLDGHAWYENADGKGTFGPPMVITTETVFTESVYAADMDGDGDVDVVAKSEKVAWYENDGAGNFGEQQVIATTGFGGGGRLVHAADVDGDGDMDVLSASSGDERIAWYENRLAGDTDDNGEVAIADFLGLSANFGSTDAEWEDGDFNGDNEVNFSDFVILANNFGKSRPSVGAPTLSEFQAADTFSTANISEEADR